MIPFQFTRSVRSLNRLRHIAQVLTRHGFGHVVTRLQLGRFVPVWMLRRKPQGPTGELPPESIGRRLAQVCGELGPTFVKLGQMLSTRPDIVPEDVLKELRLLQDRVPPFDTAEARKIVERELGKPIDQCFTSFADEPFASASIGQVYRAKIREGEEVVVKVRRPEIDDTIRLDMQLLHWLARSLEELAPELRLYRPTVIVSEFEQTLTRELDYVNEAAATARFHAAYREDPGVRIPRVFWELTTPRVLTLQAVSGVNAASLMAAGADPEGSIDRKLAASRLLDCFLKQAFDLGLFHADPHPGNLLVTPPATIGLIDFGQVGTISDEWMTELVIIVYAAVSREVDVVIDALTDMGAISLETDRASLHRSLQMLLDKYYGLPIKRFDLGTLFNEFSEIMRRHDAAVPRDFVLLIKAFSTVASVTAQLDPDLDLLELLRPRLRRALQDRVSPKALGRETVLAGWHLLNIARRAPGQLRQALRRMSAGGWRLDVHHRNIDRLIGELDRSSNRLAFSIVIASIIVGSSVVVSAGTDLTLFGVVKVQYLGIVGYLLAGVLGLGLSWAIFRSGRLH
ncbi:MAG: AarF/ABC1/UbiB kinase family protein [Planctomycetota bacterium]